ncbi:MULTISPECIES: hypothetical protein [unclassified Brevundimonas]|uniref:hypothetical protein n=1 Tax=unclassified Brevundimonas TaxID=2622653 RepID=UPI0025C2C9D9|nr:MULTISPECIES: hypothetical protein [unclassified Brevundimonas]
MTVLQRLKSVAVLGLLAGLAACGQGDKAVGNADAASVEPTPASASDVAPASSADRAVSISRMMGVQVAYLESKLGPARTIQDKERTYEIGGCTVRVQAEGGEVVGYVVPMTEACSAQALAALKDYDLPQKITLTMGEFAAARGNADFKADCLTLCGNAADPWVYLESAGPRVSPGIRASAVMVSDATIDASFRIRDAIKAAKGEDYVIDTGFNCSSEFDQMAVRELKNVRIDEIEVGYVPYGVC